MTRFAGVSELPSKIICEIFLALACCVPLVAAWSEFAGTGFLGGHAGLAVLFWPGIDWQWVVHPPVWLSMGLMSVSYLVALVLLFRKRVLGRSFLLGVLFLIVGVSLASAVNRATGWHDVQTLKTMHLAGLINRAILAHWHNPLWEELVFRGLPLLFLFLLTDLKAQRPFRSGQQARRWVAAQSPVIIFLYFAIPALATGLYHIPGHGPSRFLDSFIIGIGFSWLALRYGFAAPLALHYLLDAIIILSLHRVPGVPADEIAWLRQNAGVMNTAWSLLLLGWLCSLGLVAVLAIRAKWRRRA